MGRASTLIMVAVLLGVGALATFSAPTPEHRSVPAAVAAPNGVLPPIVLHTDSQTVDAYHAALHSPEVLAAVPCTCGCLESLGHVNNFECYVDEVHGDGTISYSTHGLYCYVCQVITRDAVAGAAAGMNGGQLHEMIVERYGRGG